MNSLREKLEAVKELKAQYYVGTLDAFRYLKVSNAVIDGPRIIAEQINKNLGDASYKASPERLVKLDGEISFAASFTARDIRDSFEEYIEFLCDYEKKGRYARSPEFQLESNSKLFGFVNRMNNFYEVPEKSAELYLEFFKAANRKRIKSDEEFHEALPEIIAEEYERIKGKIECTMPPCDSYINEFVSHLRNVDLKNHFLGRRLAKWEKLSLKSSKKRHIDYFDIAYRVLDDLIEHRTEYRRQIACLWLEENEINNWDDAVKTIEEDKADTLKRLEEARIISNKADIESYENISKVYCLVRNIIGSEKNFIVRYLAS